MGFSVKDTLTKHMIQICICIILSLSIFIGCAKKPEDFKTDIELKGLAYSQETFLQEIDEGHNETIKLFINAGIDVNARNEMNDTALMLAINKDNMEIIPLLLEHGADVNAINKKGHTVLMRACTNIQIERLSEEANEKFESATNDEERRNISNNYNSTKESLFRVQNKNRTEIVKLLIERQVDINASRLIGKNILSALAIASYNGNTEIVKLLIANGANINVKKPEKLPLFSAFNSNATQAIKILIENGAEINVNDEEGNIYLRRSIEHGNVEIAKMLIEKGIQIHSNTQGDLSRAISNVDINMIRFLLVNGANPNARHEGVSNPTVIFDAINIGNAEIVKLLIENGANLEEKAVNSHFTPLMYAMNSNSTGMAQLLIENGSNIEARSVLQTTPLILAADFGQIEIATLLLEKGAEVNAKDTGGVTALIEAARSGHAKIVNLLIENGADKNAKSTSGMNALDWAILSKDNESVRILKP